jgi:hypothetical protein
MEEPEERHQNEVKLTEKKREELRTLVIKSLEPSLLYGGQYFLAEKEHYQPSFGYATETLFSVDMFIQAFYELLNGGIEPKRENLAIYKNYSKKNGYDLEDYLERWFLASEPSGR